MSPPDTSRRADIDWIRVAAFGLLIVYHVGLVYAPWDWHVHSLHRFEPLRYLVLASNPWRLTLLFLVSGVALRFMTRRRPPLEVAGVRMARLVPPFLFGVLVLVPPQSWLEAMDKGTWSQGLVAWWLSEFSPAGLADGVPLNHLWFVLYIGLYSLIVLAICAWPKALSAIEHGLAGLLSGWGLLIWPVLYLFGVRQLWFASYGISNHLETDWYNHAMSFGVFIVGFLMALRDAFWQRLEKLRWALIGLAMIALVALMILEVTSPDLAENALAKNAMFALDQWCMLGAVLAFGSRYLRTSDGPLLRYLTDAVFPCYLAHQTILVAAIFVLKFQSVPPIWEATLLLAITLGGSLLVYEIVRRIGPLRALWGLKPAHGKS